MARDVWEEDIYVRTHEVLLYDIFYSTSIQAVGLKSALFKLVFFPDLWVQGRLPIKWTAAEALFGDGAYTTQSDVWVCFVFSTLYS